MIRVRTPRWSVEICSSKWASLHWIALNWLIIRTILFTGLKPLFGLSFIWSSSSLFSWPLPHHCFLLSATWQHFDFFFFHSSFSSPVSLSLEQVNYTAYDSRQQKKAAGDKEADIVLIRPLEDPTWNEISTLLVKLNWLTIDRGTNHAGEASEKCEEAKCRGEVVQPVLEMIFEQLKSKFKRKYDFSYYIQSQQLVFTFF